MKVSLQTISAADKDWTDSGLVHLEQLPRTGEYVARDTAWYRVVLVVVVAAVSGDGERDHAELYAVKVNAMEVKKQARLGADKATPNQ